jgi:hypothetical protein
LSTPLPLTLPLAVLAIAAIIGALALPLNSLLDVPDIPSDLWLGTAAGCSFLLAIHVIHLLLWDDACTRNLRFTHWRDHRNTPLIIASALTLHLVAVPFTALLLNLLGGFLS